MEKLKESQEVIWVTMFMRTETVTPGLEQNLG